LTKKELSDLDQLKRNLVLAALPPKDLERIEPNLESVTLSQGEIIFESGESPTYLYFPTTAVISLIYLAEDGKTAEVGFAGNIGLVGFDIFMGGDSQAAQTVVQRSGEAIRMKAKNVLDEFHHCGTFQDVLLRYTRAMMAQMSQLAVCNSLHTLQQQLCRWILLNYDQRPGNEIEVTHELIANLLGVRRESVTQSAGILQEMGVIENTRGVIKIINRKELEKIVCECYRVVADECERLQSESGVNSDKK